MKNRQAGFTLVEIAIVLVIIGLLLGGILKGQELINSARVRNLADMATGSQAAYFGFMDRYRQVPGDMTAEDAEDAIGGVFNGNRDTGSQFQGNGRLDPASYGGNQIWNEPNAAWEQLSRARFIQGDYQGTPLTEPDAGNDLAPTNPFNSPMLLGINRDYFDRGGAPLRMQLVMGRGIPVQLVRELDVKMDDGMPMTGVVRATTTAPTVFIGNNNWGGSAPNPPCVNINETPNIYNATGESLDCNAVLIF